LSDNYYSIEDAKNDGRFVVVHETKVADDRKSCVTPFFKERLDEFIGLCNKNGNGHLVIRTQGQAPFVIERYLGQNYPNIWFREYSIDGDYEISQLDGALSEQPKKPSIIIIKGAMRAGKTLNETMHIRMHIDAYKTDDSLYQSIGRYLGFPCKSGHRKQDDVFPIYISSTKLVDNIIGFFDGEFTIIPGGRWNSQSKIKRQYKMIVFDKYEDIPEEIIKKSVATNTVSGEKGIDRAKALLDRNPRESAFAGKERLTFCDGPNSNHIDSWNSLIQRQPDWEGKYFWFEPIENVIELGKLKKTVMYL